MNTNSKSTEAAAAAFNIVAIVSSAGGLAALKQLLSGLSADFPVPIVVVQHLSPEHRSMAAEILARKTPLSVKQAQENDVLATGTIYIAPPNHHLIANPDKTLSLTKTELVHFVRPSADVLFESVAESYGKSAIAVVLTGTGSDGATGIQTVKAAGGIVVVQDLETAEFSGMPSAAIQTGAVDYTLPLSDIASALTRLVKTGTAE
ncbi:MAG: chemotaxis protein CheB [Elainellaceae cyanobacterium]